MKWVRSFVLLITVLVVCLVCVSCSPPEKGSDLKPNTVRGPMIVQFTCNGRIEGTDSQGHEQVVEGERSFQLLAGVDPEDIDVVALAEALAGACIDPTVEVERPSECVTSTARESELVFSRGHGIIWFFDPREGCGNSGDITVNPDGTLRIRELIGGVWQEFNIAVNVSELESFNFERDEKGLYYVVIEYTIGEGWQGQRILLDEIFPSCNPEPSDQAFNQGWPYLDSIDPCCGNYFSVAVTGPNELRFTETFTDTQGSWEAVEFWEDDDLPSHLVFGGIKEIERGWDSEGPWIIVYIWTWDEDRGAWMTMERRFLTAEMFGRTSMNECEPAPASDKG